MAKLGVAAFTWGYRSGYYYGAERIGAGTLAMTQSLVYYVPIPVFLVAGQANFQALELEQTVAGAATSVLRLGLYADGGGAPGALLLDAGTVVATGANGAKRIASAFSLYDAMVWGAAVAQVAAGPTVRRPTSASFLVGINDATSQFGSGYTQAGVTGALPATATPGVEVGSVAQVMLQAA